MSIFSIHGAVELLKKCEYDYEKLCSETCHPFNEYHLFDLLVGLNHLYEWVLLDQSLPKELKERCFSEFYPYSGTNVSSCFKADLKAFQVKNPKLESPKSNEYQKAVRDLCNKAKHFKINKHIESSQKQYSAVFGATGLQFGSDRAHFGAFSSYAHTVDIEGEMVEINKIIGSLLDSWKSYLPPKTQV